MMANHGFKVRIALVGFLAMALGTALGTLVDVWRASTPPVEILETGDAVADGREITMRFRAERHRDCALSAVTQWRNANGVISSKSNPNKTVLAAGEQAWIELSDELPRRVRPGRYDVRSVAEYICDDGAVWSVPIDWREVHIR